MPSQQGKQNRPAKHPAIAAQKRSRRPPLTRAALALAVLATGGLMLAPLPPAGAKTTAVLIVPDHYRTIQAAVDAAAPRAVVLIKPGIYRESVTVTTSDITIRGVDRFRTVLHGGDKIPNGITVRTRRSSLRASGRSMAFPPGRGSGSSAYRTTSSKTTSWKDRSAMAF